MRATPMEEKLQALLLAPITQLGYEVVRLKIIAGKRQVLQIMIERAGGETVNVNDCERVSRFVSHLLDVEDPIAGEFVLEISSPGIDRPLIKANDFERYIGHFAKISLDLPVDGRKRLSGRIARLLADNQQVEVVLEPIPEPSTGKKPVGKGKKKKNEEHEVKKVYPALTVELQNIVSAKLVVTDALLASFVEPGM